MQPLLIPSSLPPSQPSTIPDDGTSAMTLGKHITQSMARRLRITIAAMLLVAAAALAMAKSQAQAQSHHTAFRGVGDPSSRHMRQDDQDPLHPREQDFDSEQRRLAVFGTDGRRTVSDASLYPYSAVGLVRWNADHVCTASLIGPKYVVTAAECVLTSTGARRPSTLAKPEFAVGAMAAGSTASTARVVKIHRQSTFWKQWAQDTYVILELDVALGDTLGTLLLPSAKDLNQSVGKTLVQMVGFDSDAAVASTTALKFSKCTCYFPTSFNGPQYMLHHDCDTSVVGSPGSVLLVRYTSMETYIIGIHTNAIGDAAAATQEDKTLTGYTDDVANRGVLGPFIQQHLTSLLASKGTSDGSAASSVTQETASSSGDSANTTSSSSASHSDSTTPSNDTASSSKSTSPPSKNGAKSAQKNTNDESIPASAESTTTGARISANAAYTCIALVAAAWVGVLFIAVRHLNRKRAERPPELQE